MAGTTTLHLVEKPINDDLTLVQMPDPAKFNVRLVGEHHYFVHFVNQQVVGTEFAMLHKGDNIFKTMLNVETKAYFFDDTQLRHAVTTVEPAPVQKFMAPTTTQGGTPTPCTGPIIIPPRWNQT